MEKKVKVSILVPVYNVEKYLERCLDSILEQSYKDFELILVEDCSTDNSLKICYNYANKDERIKVIEKEEHTILSDVRNIGIENARGEYLMFVDSDDYVSKDFVKKMVEAIEYQNVDVVKCKGRWYKKNQESYIESFYGYENRVFRNEEIKDELIEAFIKDLNFTTWSLIIRRNSLKVKFNTNIYCTQDKVFMFDLLMSVDSIYFLDEVLYYYYYNKSGTSNSKENYQRYISGALDVCNIIKINLSNNNILDDRLRKYINSSTLNAIFLKTYTIMNCSFWELRKELKESLDNMRVREIMGDISYSCHGVRQIIKSFLTKNGFFTLLSAFLKIDFAYVSFRKLL